CRPASRASSTPTSRQAVAIAASFRLPAGPRRQRNPMARHWRCSRRGRIAIARSCRLKTPIARRIRSCAASTPILRTGSVAPRRDRPPEPPAWLTPVATARPFARTTSARSTPCASVTTRSGHPLHPSPWRMPVVLLPQPLINESSPPPEVPSDGQPPVALVTAPPGVGKTHAMLHALASHGTRAVYVAPTHDLALQVQHDLAARGVTTHYWRQGPAEEDTCIKL